VGSDLREVTKMRGLESHAWLLRFGTWDFQTPLCLSTLEKIFANNFNWNNNMRGQHKIYYTTNEVIVWSHFKIVNKLFKWSMLWWEHLLVKHKSTKFAFLGRKKYHNLDEKQNQISEFWLGCVRLDSSGIKICYAALNEKG